MVLALVCYQLLQKCHLHQHSKNLVLLPQNKKKERKNGDGSDQLTPDMIQELDDLILVTEFSTMNSDSDHALYNAAIIKREIYEDALIARLRKPIFYWITIVGYNRVLCNVLLQQDIVDEHCFRYIVAREMVS